MLEQGPIDRNKKLSHIKELLNMVKQINDPKKSDEIFRIAKQAKKVFDELNPTDEEAKLIGFKSTESLRKELWSWLE